MTYSIVCPNCHEKISLRVIMGQKQINVNGKWITYRNTAQQEHRCPYCSETVYEKQPEPAA